MFDDLANLAALSLFAGELGIVHEIVQGGVT